MICAIRIRGQVALKTKVVETLFRLRLRRKYACIVLEKPTKEQIEMIKNVKDFVAYGELTEETYKKLIDARGKKDKDGKLKPFFRLHPARGGIKTKLHYPKGVLGDNKADINKLVEKML